MDIIWFLLIGIAAGWLAGRLVKGGGFGLIGDLVVGVIGAVLGGFVFGLLGISAGGLLGSLICATVGAVLLLVILRAIKRWTVVACTALLLPKTVEFFTKPSDQRERSTSTER